MPTIRLIDEKGQPTGMFNIAGYVDGVNCNWTQSLPGKRYDMSEEWNWQWKDFGFLTWYAGELLQNTSMNI